MVTDGESILGIGDWGTNGVSISTGKILVYTAAAGIDPAKVLPVVLDAGTNRQSLIDDPLYLGLHHERISDGRYDAFVDAFLQTAENSSPICTSISKTSAGKTPPVSWNGMKTGMRCTTMTSKAPER